MCGSVIEGDGTVLTICIVSGVVSYVHKVIIIVVVLTML